VSTVVPVHDIVTLKSGTSRSIVGGQLLAWFSSRLLLPVSDECKELIEITNYGRRVLCRLRKQSVQSVHMSALSDWQVATGS